MLDLLFVSPSEMFEWIASNISWGIALLLLILLMREWTDRRGRARRADRRNQPTRFDGDQCQQAEAVLRQSDQTIVDILASITDAFFSLDDRWCFTYLNPQAEPLLQRNVAELLGKNVWQEFPEAIDSTFYREYQRAVAERVPVTFEEFYPPLGCWFEVRAYPFEAGLSVYFRDITDRKDADAALKKSQQKLSLLLQNSPVGIIEWNPNFEITDWNPAAETIFGYSRQEAIGQPAELLVPEATKPLIQEIWTDLTQQQGGVRSTNENLTRDGRIITCDWYNTLLIDDEGQIMGAVSLMLDVSDRIEAEQQLQASQAFLNCVINGLPDPVLVKDEHHRWLLLNDAFCKFTGFDRAELLGKSDFDFFPAEQAGAFWARDEWVLAQGRENVSEEEITDAKGQLRIISTKKTYFEDGAGHKFLVGTIRDITERRRVEEEVRYQQHLLRAILDSIPHRVWLKDREGHYIAGNAALSRTVGVDREELIGKTDFDLWSFDNAEAFRQEDLLVMTSGHPVSLEERVTTPTGFCWFTTIKTPVYSDTGQVIGITGVAMDITDRKLAELALQRANIELEARVETRTAELQQLVVRLQEEIRDRQKAEEAAEYQSALLRTVIDTSLDWIFVKDCEFRFMVANHAYAAAIGKTVEEILGKTELELGLPEALVFGHPDQGMRGLRQEDEAVLAGETLHNPLDAVTRADGALQIFDTRKTPLRDSDGEIFGVLCICHDITDRKHAEEVLRRERDFTQRLIQASPTFIVTLRNDGKTIMMNDAMLQALGYTLDEVVGADYLSTFVPERDRAGLAGVLERLVTLQQPTLNENWVRTKSGKELLVEWHAVPIQGEDEGYAYSFAIGVDITDRKQAEDALRQSEAQLRQQALNLEQALRELQRTQSQLVQSEKMSSLGQLVAGVAHEINNPVNFIYGNIAHATHYARDLLHLLHLYQTYYPDPVPEIQEQARAIDLEFLMADLPKLLTSMRIGADRIEKIVASLRVFSRMDEAEFKAVDLHEGIDSTLMILQSRLRAKSDRPAIEVIKHYGNLPPIECYAGQLNQVFMNILSNAIDALDDRDRGRSLADMMRQPSTIRISTAMQGSDRVIIRISDNGPGIEDSTRQRIFDPFFTTKPVGKGTGMGLSISYQIVTEKHGGSLRCVAAPGQGAEFILEIPIHQ